MMDININTDKLRELRDFVYLSEGVEELDNAVRDLDTIIEYIDAKNGNYDFPSYETILSTCLEDVDEDDTYIVYLPLGYYVEFVHDSLAWIIWAVFYDKDDKLISQQVFWNDSSIDGMDKRNFEYYLDHFFDGKVM